MHRGARFKGAEGLAIRPRRGRTPGPSWSRMPKMSETPAPRAAVLVIGDEILSGRTKDKNIGFIAETLTDVGIDLEEVRIVPDRHEAIVEAVKALSARYGRSEERRVGDECRSRGTPYPQIKKTP